ncbi:unnamed protein product [Aphis gossypii]|uniref:LRAT domain-containing protein n=1 Tax=Aphis gossypii TaxID=80765 RepID=A0A9P0IY94_APHGO|nr:unnamed protein product [Aphis gossypii]
MNYVIFIYSFFILNSSFKLICSECCNDSWTTNHLLKYCGDGNFVHGSYCSYGSCNIFGCNCDGGCISKDQSWIRGDIVGCRRVKTSTKLAYIHTFIYAGNGRIIEVIPNKVNNGSMADQRNDRETDFCIVMNGMFFTRLRDFGLSFTQDRETILRRAEKIVNKSWPYDYFKNNCQHFISYILTNNRHTQLPGIDIDQVQFPFPPWNSELPIIDD